MSDMMNAAENMSAEYRPVALYLHDSDSVEYVRQDVACVYRRIDEMLTLVLDMRSRDIVGFRLKGFKNFYLKQLKPTQEIIQSDFLVAISVLEKAMGLYCGDIFDKAEREARKTAYREAWQIAYQNNVELRDLPRVA